MVKFMNLSVEYLKKTYKENSDFVVREINIDKNQSVYIIFFESLVNAKSIYNFVIKNIYKRLECSKKLKDVKSLVAGPKLQILSDENESIYYLENGFALIFFRDEKYAIEVKAELDRGVTMSQTEPNMYGPKDSFCENFQKNLGLIKRRIKSRNLKVESVDHGIYTKTKIGVLYIDDKVNKNALEKIKNLLNACSSEDVVDSFDVRQRIMKSKMFPTIFKTEKPAIVAKFLLKGYIVISIDNTPFMLVIDARFQDFINPVTTDKFVRVLRYLCLFLTIMTPAIYIALINFNQETLPTSLLINFTQQRSGVPFPAILEAMIMLFICEILRESDIRFPSNYGSSASILGALVLGEAAVSAGIVSPIMIIVVAISFITSLIFTDTKLVSAIRIMRIISLVIASFLGLYGLSIGFIAGLSILANVKMNEGTYL